MKVIARLPDGTSEKYENGKQWLNFILDELKKCLLDNLTVDLTIQKNWSGVLEIKWKPVTYILIPEEKD